MRWHCSYRCTRPVCFQVSFDPPLHQIKRARALDAGILKISAHWQTFEEQTTAFGRAMKGTNGSGHATSLNIPRLKAYSVTPLVRTWHCLRLSNTLCLYELAGLNRVFEGSSQDGYPWRGMHAFAVRQPDIPC